LVLTPLQINKEENAYLRLMHKIITKGDRRFVRGEYVRSLFAKELKFDLRKGNIPLCITNKTYFKGIVCEFLMHLQGITDTKLALESKGIMIWRPNTTREFLDSKGLAMIDSGHLGESYGHNWRSFGMDYDPDKANISGSKGGIDQLRSLVTSLRNDPFGRRHILLNWYPNAMCPLPPCQLYFQFYVTAKGLLNCYTMNRSSDFCCASLWNAATAALFTRVLCNITGYKPGKLIIKYIDVHIYEKHIENALAVQLNRIPDRPYPILKEMEPYTGSTGVSLDKYIDSLKYEDFSLVGYDPYSSIKYELLAGQ
jgi:thymidylate synthase